MEIYFGTANSVTLTCRMSSSETQSTSFGTQSTNSRTNCFVTHSHSPKSIPKQFISEHSYWLAECSVPKLN